MVGFCLAHLVDAQLLAASLNSVALIFSSPTTATLSPPAMPPPMLPVPATSPTANARPMRPTKAIVMREAELRLEDVAKELEHEDPGTDRQEGRARERGTARSL